MPPSRSSRASRLPVEAPEGTAARWLRRWKEWLGPALALPTIAVLWAATQGGDPLFAAIDGMNCPHLPPGDAASHSLLLERGLIRVALPWPPVDAGGEPVEPEFALEVVRDPTGCNTHPVWGVGGERREVSVYRRPRPAANLRYVASSGFGVSPFIGKTGMLAAIDPDTGRPVNMNMMADAREATLRTQAQSAARTHLELAVPLSRGELDAIEAFERQLYAAQAFSQGAGALDEPDGPSGLGPRAMEAGSEQARKERLTAAFNRGYRSFASVYASCTEQAVVAEQRYRNEGATLATEITARFGN